MKHAVTSHLPNHPPACLLTVDRSFAKPEHYLGVLLIPLVLGIFTFLLFGFDSPNADTRVLVLLGWLVAVALGGPTLVLMIRKIATSEQITITSEMVHVRVQCFGTAKGWSEPLSHYNGVLKTQHLGGWSPATRREKPTVLCLYLVHPTRSKTVLLWKEQGGQREEELQARRLWLRYANVLNTVPLEETAYGMKEYHPEDFQEQIVGRSHAGSRMNADSTHIRPDHVPFTSFLEQFASGRTGLESVPAPPEEASIEHEAGADFFIITYPRSPARGEKWASRGDILLVALMFVLGVSGIMTGIPSVGCLASILMLAGALIGFVSWMRWNIKYEVSVTPSRILYCWMGPTQRVEIARLAVDEVEEMEVKQHYCNMGDELSQPGVDWALVLITATQIQPIGRGLPKEALRWMKTAIIHWLCEWYSREGEK